MKTLLNRQNLARFLLADDVDDPLQPGFKWPPNGIAPIEHLPVKVGFTCVDCDYACIRRNNMRCHVRKQHSQRQRVPAMRSWTQCDPELIGYKAANVQCLFGDTCFRRYWWVDVSKKPPAVAMPASVAIPVHLSDAERFRMQIMGRREASQQKLNEQADVTGAEGGFGEVSPWLEMTRWPAYLKGFKFAEVVPLAAVPSSSEPVLVTICDSLDRLLVGARKSLDEDKINVFDQTRINSFIHARKAADRPLFAKLQKGTWRKYQTLWKRLLCFVYRTSDASGSGPSLSHKLTAQQIMALSDVVESAKAVSNPAAGSQVAHTGSVERVDRACLELCISLLDHTLKGSLFESSIVGFLAVIGIDAKNGNFLDACSYTPYLSAFRKIAQMLVLQRAVVGAENGEVEYPADLLDEMRDRFLLHGTRSPFNWVLRLAAYGGKVRDNTTSIGYMHWSEDKKTLFYKDTLIRMDDFKKLARIQVEACQQELEGLLFLRDEADRSSVPSLRLADLKDNATISKRNASFLTDERNQSMLEGKDTWLLNRLFEDCTLREEFLYADGEGQTAWHAKAVALYLEKIRAFLCRLAFLIHLTSGQPARATELMSLRYQNSIHGYHRNVYIEEGLVSTVTAYHKGYSVSGSTKIIHRYLPKEVGELLIYYLWLIRPFEEDLTTFIISRQARVDILRVGLGLRLGAKSGQHGYSVRG